MEYSQRVDRGDDVATSELRAHHPGWPLSPRSLVFVAGATMENEEGDWPAKNVAVLKKINFFFYFLPSINTTPFNQFYTHKSQSFFHKFLFYSL